MWGGGDDGQQARQQQAGFRSGPQQTDDGQNVVCLMGDACLLCMFQQPQCRHSSMRYSTTRTVSLLVPVLRCHVQS